MRQAAKRSLLTVMATGGVLASTAGYAYADAGAVGAATDSPGVGSGNSIQVPISAPVNVCGDTVNVVGLLNPASGNDCGNSSRHGARGGNGSSALGHSQGSPGVGSGNAVQIPVDIPVNACGDSVTAVGGLNPAYGNHCASHSGGNGGGSWGGGTPPTGGSGWTPPIHCSCTPPPPPSPCPPPRVSPPPPVTKHHSPPPPAATLPTAVAPQSAVLASTGAAGVDVLLPTAAALMLGGGVLYRRSRRQGQR